MSMVMFTQGRAMVSPRNCGLRHGEIPQEELLALTPQLTEVEKASCFAKYYYQPMAPLQPEHYIAIDGGPMDPADGFLPDQVGRQMLNTGHCQVENGYCALPNGVGYSAIKVDQIGRTEAQINKYNRDFAPEENLFYKIWCPGDHILHFTDGMIEDLGWGVLNMKQVSGCLPRTLGINPDEVLQKDPQCIHIVATSILVKLLTEPEAEPEYLSMMLYTRETPEGREMRARFWIGLLFTPEGFTVKIPKGPVTVTEMSKKIMIHCMREYTNENRLIDAFWNF
ncbi:MAG: DAPG hydrolase family protein [Saccharofermentanales bacterium]|jgi:hypothetical protein|nr:hypothetical protein [Clostridiaceae bacterium]